MIGNYGLGEENLGDISTKSYQLQKHEFLQKSGLSVQWGSVFPFPVYRRPRQCVCVFNYSLETTGQAELFSSGDLSKTGCQSSLSPKWIQCVSFH